MQRIRTAVRNAVILVMDQTVGKIPESMKDALVAGTDSCVAVGTLCGQDGETLISLSDDKNAEREEPPLFDGVLNTPSRRLSVCSVLDESLMAVNVPGSQTRVRIWANHSTAPDEIWIVVGNHPG